MQHQQIRQKTVEIILTLLLGGLLGWGTWVTNVGNAHGNRLVRIETRNEALEKNQDNMLGSLRRIEDKLDKAMEKK